MTITQDSATFSNDFLVISSTFSNDFSVISATFSNDFSVISATFHRKDTFIIPNFQTQTHVFSGCFSGGDIWEIKNFKDLKKS